MLRRLMWITGGLVILVTFSVAVARRAEPQNYWIIYSAIADDFYQNIYRVQVPSGQIQPVTSNLHAEGQAEVMGDWLVFNDFDAKRLMRIRGDGIGQSVIAENVSDQTVATTTGKVLFTDLNHALYCAGCTDALPLVEDQVNSFDWSPNGREIAFSTFDYQQRRYGIYRMDVDRTARTQLVEMPTPIRMVQWSPDGQYIGYINQNMIYVYDLVRDEVRRLYSGIYVNDYAWSPDGKAVALSSDHNIGYRQTDIYRINADGTNPIRLSNRPQNEYHVSWSPDGRWIAFTSDANLLDGRAFIYRVPAEGGDVEQLTASGMINFSPRWYPMHERALHSPGLIGIGLAIIGIAQFWIARKRTTTPAS